MGKIVRKNLMVDAEALRELARMRGTSESEAARYAIKRALAAEDMVAAMQELADMGAFTDFEKLFPPPPEPAEGEELTEEELAESEDAASARP